LPLVCVRTGAAPDPAAGAEAAAWLVRLRGATPAPLGAAAEACPLDADRGAAADLAPDTEPARPAVWRGRGGRSWRTTWIVLRITCVRTSATCAAPALRDPCVEGRSE